MDVRQIAKLCYEANRAYCQIMEDDSAYLSARVRLDVPPPWGEASEHVVRSVIEGVEYHRANPHAGASDSHENWLAFKRREGWTYGEQKSEPFKTHPLIVPYADLDVSHKLKDHLFVAIVHACGAPHGR